MQQALCRIVYMSGYYTVYVYFSRRLKYFIYQLIMFAHTCSKLDACVFC